MKKALVCGAGGFIGSHMVDRLVKEDFHVKGVDLKLPEFSETSAHEFVIGDLTDQSFCNSIFEDGFDEVYQFAADMGGAGYIFTGENDAQVMYNSAAVNLNVLEASRTRSAKKFSSHPPLVFTQNIIKEQLHLQLHLKIQPIQQILIVIMVGKNLLVNVFTTPMRVITVCGRGLQDTTISLGRLALGQEEKKKRQRLFVAR